MIDHADTPDPGAAPPDEPTTDADASDDLAPSLMPAARPGTSNLGDIDDGIDDDIDEVVGPTLAWAAQLFTGIVIVGICTFIALVTMHPGLLVTNTTPTGGDMGAHVWGPAYLRDHLLSGWKLNGWTMDWYSGFPIYRFYMVVPALMITILDVVLPYGVAFKLVAVSGIVTLPVSCWAFGRLARLRYPMPEMFAVVGLIYLFDESYTIYGGNIASTMAGEFSFSIALSFAILGLGLMANGLQTGNHRVKAAIVIALAGLCHGLVLIFVFVGLVVMGLLYVDKQRFVYWFTTCFTAALLASFWVLPFLFNHAYMTDMKYQGEPGHGSFDSYWDMFFALPQFWDIFFTTLAVIGLVIALVRVNLVAIWVGVTGLLFSSFVFLFRESLPGIGLLWNPRLLPFVNMCRYLLTAYAIHEIGQALWRGASYRRWESRVEAARREHGDLIPTSALPAPRSRSSIGTGLATISVFFLGALTVLGFRFQVLPFGHVVTENGSTEYRWMGISTDYSDDGFVDGWAQWNFAGYEGVSSGDENGSRRKYYYGEYYDVVQTMKALGNDPAHGCGRALWENNGENDKYGTTMALMLLPFWTDGCIGSSEGLFFEASGTTPYHFLTAAAMSKQSSNPVRQLRYANNDASIGVQYLQDLGMRYYLAVTPEAIAEADAQPDLTLVDEAGPWRIYEVAGSDIVVPLTVQPVVVDRRSGDARETWLEVGTSWFQNRDEWAAIPVDAGPDEWQRIEAVVDQERVVGTGEKDPARQVNVVVPGTEIVPVPLDPVAVSDVEIGDQSVSFRVDKVGVPVLVRVSYFPNWDVAGAQGPYRIAPNMMVVIPTSNDVTMSFGRSSTDVLAYVLTLIGIGLAIWLWRLGPVRYTQPPLVKQLLTAIAHPRPPGAMFVDPTPWPPGESSAIDRWSAPDLTPLHQGDDTPDALDWGGSGPPDR